MITIFIFLTSFFNHDCRDQYLNKALESYGYSRHYIVVNVTVNKRSGQVVVLNRNLYELLKRKNKNNLDRQRYRDMMTQKIATGENLVLCKRDLARLQTEFISADTLTESWAQKGKEAFFSKFFYVSDRLNYARLKYDVPPSSFTTIVRILFNWNYLVSSVEGQMSIEDLNFCDDRIENR